MRRIATIFLGLCAVLLLFITKVDAAEITPIEQFEYVRKAPETVLLTKYVGKGESVTIPNTYLLDGASFRVELAAKTVFSRNETLTAVSISSKVTFEGDSMQMLFAKCKSLHTVNLKIDTSGITDMSYLFYGCESLEQVDLSQWNTANVRTMQGMFSNCSNLIAVTGHENWDTGSLDSIAYMFNATKKIETVDMSRWDLAGVKNTGWCFQHCGASTVLLPENLAIISAGFFNHTTAYSDEYFTVPAGVKKIGYAHTFYDFATEDFREFRVAEGNNDYQVQDGILYSADGTEMLAIPRGKMFKDGLYIIPEGVTFLGELSFSRNKNITTVLLPDSYMLRYVPVQDSAYITFKDTGNLNAGLNLNIAIYSYTGVKNYKVKDSNPNYKSIDGILYTKDMAALVAVPTGYAGDLRIPDGVTEWKSAAMWSAGELVDGVMKECTGVYIPASLTQIADDQLEKLNRLESRFSKFKITVHKDNPVYYLGKSGQLLKRSNLENAQITLLADSLTYDGDEKQPDVKITLNGKILKEGKDYTLSYIDNINAGTGWVRVTGKGNYYGMVEDSFQIKRAVPAYTVPVGLRAVCGQQLAEIQLPKGFIWIDSAETAVTTGEHSFLAGYTSDNPNYLPVDDIAVAVQVDPRPVTSDAILVSWWNPWTDRPIEPKVIVIDQNEEISATEYTLRYENNVDFGKGKVIVEDVPGGNYNIEGTAEFFIVPGPVLCIVVLTMLWCMTTGVSLILAEKGPLSVMPPKNR